VIIGGDTVVLAEGSIHERLRRDPETPFDAHVGTGALVLDERYREPLAAIHRAYLQVAIDAGLPMLLQTDTWRTTAARIAESSFRGNDLNRANAELVLGIAAEGRLAGGTVVVAGLLGPAGDAYAPAEALSVDEARRHHAPQADALAASGVDLLLCATVPALSEAIGLAAAMAATGLPYLVGFVVRPTGRLLDGTALDDAVAAIDERVAPTATAFLLNCVHPRVADAALAACPRATPRVIGLLANTSARDPDELDGLAELETAEPEPFARELADVAARRGLSLVGGCCGTGDEHIAALARILSSR
jgi:homocysteine S-methyltransferase